MANPWFRLWTDMATDPKWRTIAKKSGQSIGNVISVYLHMMTCASNATERGRTQGFDSEDVANALDIETSQVEDILAAMEGRVVENGILTGWEKRQPIREDSSASRAKAWRESQKERKRTQTNANERKRTLDTDKIQIREDKEKSKPKEKEAPEGDLFFGVPNQVVIDFKAMRAKQQATITKTVIDGIKREASKAGITLTAALTLCCERSWRSFKAEWVIDKVPIESAKQAKFDALAYVNRVREPQHVRPVERDITGEIFEMVSSPSGLEGFSDGPPLQPS